MLVDLTIANIISKKLDRAVRPRIGQLFYKGTIKMYSIESSCRTLKVDEGCK